MSNYWSERQKELYAALEKDERALKERLFSIYESEYRKLDREIAAYYQKYGVNNVITYRRLMETLSAEDSKMLIEQMEEFMKKYPQYSHLVPVRTSIYKLNRLEGLQYSIRMHQLEIGAVNQEKITEHLNKQALRGLNAAAEMLGFGKNFYAAGSDIIKLFVDVPWCSGTSFSQRIWQNTDKLSNYLTTDIAQGFARGESYEKLTRQLRTRFEHVSKRDAYRLIYTEGTYVMAESSMQPFTEDFEKYRISTAADGKVCRICSSAAKATFYIKDRKPGVNFPPFHSFCRCTFEIIVDDWDEWMDKYIAKHSLNDDEKYAVNQYVSSKSYRLNEKLRRDMKLTAEENKLIMNLDSALRKLPKYEGDLSRSLKFENDEAINEFLSNYKVGNTIEYKEFLSTTCGNTYNPDGQVQIYILDSKNGSNITMLNPGEQEILYSRNSKFFIYDIYKENDYVFIILNEV